MEAVKNQREIGRSALTFAADKKHRFGVGRRNENQRRKVAIDLLTEAAAGRSAAQAR